MPKSFLDLKTDEETPEAPVETEPPKTPPKPPSKPRSTASAKELKDLQTAVKRMESKLKDAQNEVSSLTKENMQLSNKNMTLDEQLTEANRVLETHTLQVRDLTIEIAQMQSENSRLNTVVEKVPQSAAGFLYLVRDFMWNNPTHPLAKKALRHLPPNPEWKGKMKKKHGRNPGGGWSGAWKDFCSLLEFSIRG